MKNICDSTSHAVKLVQEETGVTLKGEHLFTSLAEITELYPFRRYYEFFTFKTTFSLVWSVNKSGSVSEDLLNVMSRLYAFVMFFWFSISSFCDIRPGNTSYNSLNSLFSAKLKFH